MNKLLFGSVIVLSNGLYSAFVMGIIIFVSMYIIIIIVIFFFINSHLIYFVIIKLNAYYFS